MKRVLRAVAALAIVGGIGLELASPGWARHQATDAARAAARAGALRLATSKDLTAARAEAARVAHADGADLDAFTQEPNGTVQVTVSIEARSYVLRHLSATRDWYQIKETASSPPG